ncbi:hypothetical protein SLEP1_g41861 [Rubroshorea leprosula]|uniref:Uncharacterized protein n=1 Tax=Rubroshorea leprosula TaxID=152421 RepID=A0AAV5L7W1_9ROSI|nr:hypothetical protein SLEP1_g41861 [Rubroshorea leprosula]
MGSCFSLETAHPAAATSPSAQVVSIHGELHEYGLPVFVSQVLQSEGANPSSSSSNGVFLCNSDQLCYDECIPALDFDKQLQPNQIYFVLPFSKLKQRISSKDMAALAVKASVAIQNAAKKDSKRNKARISPVLPVSQTDIEPIKIKPAPPPPVLSRSSSVRKLQRYTSRRAKLAVRSFRLRLSTIYEGSVLS